jgi:hypothetical protein
MIPQQVEKPRPSQGPPLETKKSFFGGLFGGAGHQNSKLDDAEMNKSIDEEDDNIAEEEKADLGTHKYNSLNGVRGSESAKRKREDIEWDLLKKES